MSVLVAPGELADGASIELDDAETHHLRVRRIEAAADVQLFDGVGRSALGVLSARGHRMMVQVGIVQQASPPPATLLAVGAGDKDRFLSLAERCTELGIARLVPMTTERSQGVDTRFRDSWIEKARRRAREACKQSGNPWATAVEESCAHADLDATFPGTRWLLASADGGPGPQIGATEEIGWIIGPEGGLTTPEGEFTLTKFRAEPVTLGPNILRFDTAAVAAAVITHDRRLRTMEE